MARSFSARAMTRIGFLLCWLACGAALAQSIATRQDALDKLSDAAPASRAEAVYWFVKNGTSADDVQLLPRLSDENRTVRQLAEQGMWVLWSRSGDAQIDALMEKGAEQMQARMLK